MFYPYLDPTERPTHVLIVGGNSNGASIRQVELRKVDDAVAAIPAPALVGVVGNEAYPLGQNRGVAGLVQVQGIKQKIGLCY